MKPQVWRGRHDTQHIDIKLNDTRHKWHRPKQHCHYAERRVLFFCYVDCHYAKCHYAECHYAECRGALEGQENEHASKTYEN